MEILFWISAVLAAYAYAGYPLTLWLLARLKGARDRPQTDDHPTESVSIIISARNEGRTIRNRLENILEQSYPLRSIELIVVSDGSEDDTAEILEQMSGELESRGLQRVLVIELAENKGKPNAINLAVEQCRNDILVMADARQSFDPDAISALVRELNDPTVGCVSGQLQLLADSQDDSSGVEMGAYWYYELFIRRTESKVSSVIGMTGAIYAIRKELFRNIPSDTLIDDVLIPMIVIKQGFKARFTAQARAFDKISVSSGQEWQRKTRTMAGNWQLLFAHSWLLSPRQNPAFFYFFSHKVMRLLFPFLVISTLLSAYLIGSIFHDIVATLVVAGVLIGTIGVIAPSSRSVRLISLAFFFLILNTAVVVGLYRYLAPQKKLVWSDAHKENLP